MARDDDFTPKLGRIGVHGSGQERTYLQRMSRAIAQAGRRNAGTRGQRFQGSQIGRGAGAGRVLASRDRYAAFRSRRVIVKSRIVKLAGRKLDAARAHLRYIQRDGVTRDGEPGQLYDTSGDQADGRAFLSRSEGDRHQFRFIVAPEDGAEYDELHGFTRRLIGRMEEDLHTKLDWVAVDHYNTGHPHTHIVLRGRDERGRDLIIAREYMSHGMRERACEIADFDLGPRSDSEIEDRWRNEVEQERFTSLDRGLLREASRDGLVRSGAEPGEALRQTLRAGRLQKLRRLGLAEEVEPGRWRLAPDLEPVLRRMGERGDIIKTMNRVLAREQLARSHADRVIYDATEGNPRLVGRVVERGLSDEINDRHYLIVDGVDGRAHYVETGWADETDPVREGAIVAISPRPVAARDADRTVAAVAAASGGRYTVDHHLRHDRTATQTFAEAHVRRLEAMRRAGVGVERLQDGSWVIAPDHLERAAAYERLQAKASPVRIETLSPIRLEHLAGIEGATWLDGELLADKPTPLRDSGFGKEVGEALRRRRIWLIEQELAREEQGRMVYRANLLAVLRRRELVREGERLSDELEMPYRELRPGEPIEGRYSRRIDLASGRFALIETDREFTLVPWRPVLERNLGQQVSGISHGEAISWTFGKQRGGQRIE